jgi:hypothetical protein
MPTMPIEVQNSSSSLDPIDLGDHFLDSLYQQTPLVKGYLQDMAVHQVVAVGHDIIGAYRTGTPRTLIISSIPFVFVNSSYRRLPLRHDFALF